MAVLRERIETRLDIEEAFDFVADFANSASWDPGVATSERIDDGPLKVGARYLLGVRMNGRTVPMTYTITHFDRPKRVVLAGEGSGVSAVDDISFQSAHGVTAISYTADIRLRGVLRLLAPFAGGALRRVAENAREGMQRALDGRAATGGIAAGRAVARSA